MVTAPRPGHAPATVTVAMPHALFQAGPMRKRTQTVATSQESWSGRPTARASKAKAVSQPTQDDKAESLIPGHILKQAQNWRICATSAASQSASRVANNRQS